MKDDLQCPYCEAGNEVCHDDGFGYEEGVAHEIECGSCEKSFIFFTAISFDYEPQKAPCLNGGEHEMGKVYCSFYPDWMQCKICNHDVRGEYKKHPDD